MNGWLPYLGDVLSGVASSDSAEQRERLTRFFAAGIVGENPQQFGLTTDSPLSNLYPRK